jgi:septum formation protein
LNPKIILASKSPRRQELLKLFVNEFDVIPAQVDEKRIAEKIMKTSKKGFAMDVKNLVLELADSKAEAVHKNFRDALVIGADTVVVSDGKILGKPSSNDDAFDMIRSLAGKTHIVITGVCLKYGFSEDSFVSVSKVRFYKWNEQMEVEVNNYIKSGKAMDKAGGYGIQEEAGLWVKWIKGDYNNIVGLPVSKLNRKMNVLINRAHSME